MSVSSELVWTKPTGEAWWPGLSAEIDKSILSEKKPCLGNSNLSEDTELESVESPPQDLSIPSSSPLPISTASLFQCSGTSPSIPFLKQRLIEMLARFEFTKAIDVAGVQETLCELEEIQPGASQIENSRILKTLKIAVNALKTHTHLKAKAYVLYLQWKHIVLQHEIHQAIPTDSELPCVHTQNPHRSVTNRDLRKKVCRKIARTLQDNKFDVMEAQTLALNIENNIRQRDPAMKRTYMLLFKCMIRDIKRLDRDKYIRFSKY